MEKLLKTYDRFLKYKRNMDGSIKITRTSPFGTREYLVLDLRNIRIGKWIIKRLYAMDTQRKDIVKEVLENNKRIRDRYDDSSTRDMAEFMLVDRVII